MWGVSWLRGRGIMGEIMEELMCLRIEYKGENVPSLKMLKSIYLSAYHFWIVGPGFHLHKAYNSVDVQNPMAFLLNIMVENNHFNCFTLVDFQCLMSVWLFHFFLRIVEYKSESYLYFFLLNDFVCSTTGYWMWICFKSPCIICNVCGSNNNS